MNNHNEANKLDIELNVLATSIEHYGYWIDYARPFSKSGRNGLGKIYWDTNNQTDIRKANSYPVPYKYGPWFNSYKTITKDVIAALKYILSDLQDREPELLKQSITTLGMKEAKRALL